MPGCAVHLLLAHKVLQAWEADAEAAPFSVTDSLARNAFLSGANAPDMGYYPGGLELITDLSHYVNSDELVKNLVLHAETDVERAFAWGWLTHVLGDGLLHPVVNQAAGELMKGSRDQVMTYDDDPAAHVRVEMGMDAWFCVREGVTPQDAPTQVFDEQSISFLQKAYRATYDAELDRAKIYASHRSTSRYLKTMLRIDQIHGSKYLKKRLPFGAQSFKWSIYILGKGLTKAFQRGTTLYALTHVVEPGSWFIEEVDAVLNSFAERYLHHYNSQLEELPRYNLDTGEEKEADPAWYRPAIKAREELEALKSAA